MRTVSTARDLDTYSRNSIIVSESKGLVFKIIAVRADGKCIYLPLYFFDGIDRELELDAEYILGDKGGSALLIDVNEKPIKRRRLNFGDTSSLHNIKLVSTKNELVEHCSNASLIITEHGNCFELDDGIMQSDGTIDWSFYQTYGGRVDKSKPGFSIDQVLPIGSALLFFWDDLGPNALLFDELIQKVA